jgi:formate dehydrogenase major subunit
MREEVRMRRSYSRLEQPLVRENGDLRPASFEEAIEKTAAGLSPHQGDSFGLFSCSKATNETNYIAQKFARLVMDSNNVDSCNRT